MKWRGRRGSRNIEDRRSGGGGRGVTRGGIGGLGIGGVVLVLAIGYFTGIDVMPFLTGSGTPTASGPATPITRADEEAAQFVSVTLADTEEVWADIFADQVGRAYQPATLVLFKEVTDSPCGGAAGATGPFYCPADEKAYLDTAFFTTLSDRLGAEGDFAQAYVVAHEIGHHVQNELGILRAVNEARRAAAPAEANALSVRLELQADCFAGIWAKGTQERFDTLEPGDVAEAMTAARQIGDDTLARESGRAVRPHTFTHGTSEQRMRWFQTGYTGGTIADCDTFAAARL